MKSAKYRKHRRCSTDLQNFVYFVIKTARLAINSSVLAVSSKMTSPLVWCTSQLPRAGPGPGQSECGEFVQQVYYIVCTKQVCSANIDHTQRKSFGWLPNDKVADVHVWSVADECVNCKNMTNLKISFSIKVQHSHAGIAKLVVSKV